MVTRDFTFAKNSDLLQLVEVPIFVLMRAFGVETDKDIINRVKYDIFYLENWSLIMDLKIIFQTIINIFQGEDKAY